MENISKCLFPVLLLRCYKFKVIKHKSYLKIKKLGIFKNIKDFKSLEKRIEKISTKNASNLKGDIFEIFVQGLILNDANFNAKIVYPSLKQTPPQIRKKLKVGTVDKGIDGIFINHNDDIIPYQAKFRSLKELVDYGDTLKIEHQGKYASQRYYFYNSKSITREFFDEEKKNIAVGPHELNKLESSFFKRFEDWFISYKPPIKKRTEIDGYQQITIDRVSDEFKVSDRATIAMACGSGKSLISFWIAEKLHFKNIVVFLPSKALLKQIREEWLRERYLHGVIEHISVFSEREASDYDAQEINQSELIFKIVNKKEDINKFLSRNTKNTKIVFCTYQSSPLLSSSMPKNFSFNYGVFDEAHKTTSNKIIKRGSKQQFSWNMPLQEKFIKINKRLFMTATLRKTNFKIQNKLGYEQINFSMKNESQYGRVVDEFTFAKARKEGVICPVKVIVSIVTNEELHFKNISKTAVNIENESVKTEQVAHQIAIKQAIKKYNCKKIFTYHSRCEDAFSFTKNAPEGIKTHLPNFECAYIDGSMSLSDRDDIMQTFKDTKKGLISNARCLIEGVNIPAVDMVTFVSPKSSAVDIVQASGRAMRVRGLKDKKYGYILLPIFVERFRGEKISRAINRTDFNVVLKFLKALSDYDETIKEEISFKVINYFRKKGRKQKQRKINKEKEIENTSLEFVGKSFDIKDIEDSIDLKIINFFGLKFEEYVAELTLYKERFGNTDVPFNSKGKYSELSIWVNKLRTLNRNNYLDNFRRKQLDKIGFNWNFEGETLDSVEGLISLNDFAKKLNIHKETFRESVLDKNIIKPYGFRRSYPFTTKMLDEYFQPSQIEEVYRKLNITIKNTYGFLTLQEFEKYTLISRKKITELIEKNQFIPAGFGKTKSTLSSPYFKKNQKKDLYSLFDEDEIRLLKINTDNVKDKIRFDKLIKERLISAKLIRDLIKKNKIKYYVYYFKGNSGPKTYFFHKSIIKKIYRLMGVTIFKTNNLLTYAEFTKKIKNISYKKTKFYKKIKPVGYGIDKSPKSTKIVAYYKKSQVDKYFKLRGITIRDVSNLISGTEIYLKLHFTKGLLDSIIKDKIIKPKGKNIYNKSLVDFFSKDSIDKIVKYYGKHCTNCKNLVEESKISNIRGLSDIFQGKKYRFLNVLKPRCRIFSLSKNDDLFIKSKSSGRKSNTREYYYHMDDVKKYLREEKGVTLFDTKDLICVHDYRKTNLTLFNKIKHAIKINKIKIKGYAYGKTIHSGVSPYITKKELTKLKNI